MINKALKLFVCIITLSICSVIASAQVKEVAHEFSAFDSIEIDYDFQVNVVRTTKTYSITLTVDDILLDYVQTYVKNRTLHISMDQKALPSDIKKLFKGRNSPDPVLLATVYTPDDLQKVTMSASSTLSVQDEMNCKAFEIELKDNAQIRKLNIDGSDVTIKTANKSVANLLVYADNIKVDASGNSEVKLEQDSQVLDVKASGNGSVTANGETLAASVNSNGSSKVTLVGKTDDLSIVSSGLAFVDALNFKTADCKVQISGNSKVYETASEALHIDATGNSTLIFDEDPKIEIINIKSSTVQKYESTKNDK